MPTALVTPRISAPRADDQIRFSRGKIGLFVAQGLRYFLQEEFRRHRRNWRAVQNERVFPNAWVAIMKDGLTPLAAADRAFKRLEEIFAKYPIAQG